MPDTYACSPRLDPTRFSSTREDIWPFVACRANDWKRLETLLKPADAPGTTNPLRLDEVRELFRLYRASCADALAARDFPNQRPLAAYLNELALRAHAQTHARAPHRARHVAQRCGSFFAQQFPRLVRAEWRLLTFAAALVCLGAAFGAWVIYSDPGAYPVVVPDMHLMQTPTERVLSERIAGAQDLGRSTLFSSYLFTHNIQVTFLVFALGITLGMGSAILLFWNGIPIGALAAQYHQSGQAAFFWAWVLPHGVLELPVVFIAGAAGFVLARGLWFPGERPRQHALVRESRRAVQLIVGGMPLLVFAGIVEGTLSQWHAPLISAPTKLAAALALLALLIAYLRRGAARP